MTRSTFDPQQRYGVPAENWRYRLRYLGETAFDRLLYYGLKPLPLDWGAALVGEAARWLLPLSPVARRVEKHLAIGLPERSPAERRRIARDVYRYTGRLLAEYSQLNRLFRQIESRCEVEGLEHIAALKAQKRGMLFIGAHLGNWELMAYWGARDTLPALNIYARPRNPFLDREITRIRSQFGMLFLPRGGKENVATVQRILRDGGALTLFPDQRLRGPELDFMGQPARTMLEHFRWAKAANAALLPVRVLWTGKGVRYRITFFAPLDEGSAEAPRQSRDLAAEMNQIYAEWIRENPEQWFWSHKRWDPIKRRRDKRKHSN